MKNTTSSPGIPISLPEAAHCLHCGEELGLSNTVYSNGDYFCCTGCSSVYELLNTLGLQNFYKIKEEQNIGKTGRPIDAEAKEEYGYLDQDNFINQYTSPETPLTMNFYIEGIHCGACLWLIEKIPDYSPHIESVSLNMSSNVAIVNFRNKKKFSSFPQIVKRFGYKAHPIKVDEEAQELKQKENRKSLIRISVAAVCAGNIMLLSAAIYSGAEGIFAEKFGLLNLLLTLPVVTYCAFPFYKSVVSSLRSKRVTVDIPIVFVILVGFLLSSYNFVEGNDQVYFDSVTAFVFLLLSSRYFLKSIQDRISNNKPSSRSLFNQNKILIWDNRNKQFFLEPLDEVKPGQRVKINNGDRIPVDGKLLSHRAELNLSVLTGENIPQTLLKNDFIYAGSILNSDQATIEVINTGSSTRIGKLLDEVERNYKSKISSSTYSDKFAAMFTLIVGITAAISFLAIFTVLGPSAALNRVMAFVLIACPCAFVFALPLTFGLSLNKAVEKGILVKSSNVFDKIPHIKNIFFDKTGTLTNGVYKILKWNTEALSRNEKAAILAIEKKSSHPIARTLVSHINETDMTLPEVIDFKHIYTKGVSANVDGNVYEILSDKNVDDTNEINEIITTKTVIRKNGQTISELYLGDSLKEDAKYVVNLLQKKAYRVHILSGDNENNVKNTALKLGIHQRDIYWGKTPEEKAQIIKDSQNTLMVGDGLNDASAFSSADVAVSVQGSVEESLKVSDAYILNNSLFNIVDLIEYGKVARDSITRNTRFSIAYNIAAGTLALFGYINPLMAAVLMPLSSVLLIGSSLYGHNKLDIRRGTS